MGEKGNGGHVPVGGARAVRTAAGPGDLGLGGSQLGGGDAGSGGGGGLLSSLAGEATDHVTDVGQVAFEQAQEHRQED
jgi:hypothetical protein